MAANYKWHPIEDLEGDPKALTEGELDALRRIWASQKAELAGEGTLEEFDKRLRREWSIETGVIERVYTLDSGVTRTLIAHGIDAALIPHGASNRDSTLVARIIQDHYDVLEGIFDFVGGRRELSAGYVKELHAALLRNQDTYTVVDQFGRAFEKRLEKGQYKAESNSPTRPDGTVHEYCPPEHVAAEMERLIDIYRKHQSRDLPVEVEAAFLHHRFAQIHPFSDGNGRVARALASLVFIKAGWFPVIVKRDEWERYVAALEAGDAGDLRPLVAMFVEGQRNAVIQASEIAYEVRPIETAHDAILAARDRLMMKGALPLQEWAVAKDMAGQLSLEAQNRLRQLAQELEREITGVGRWFSFEVGTAQWGAEPGRMTVLAGCEQTADFDQYDTVLYLKLGLDDRALIISFHALGPRYRGIIGVATYLRMKGLNPKLVPGGTFQINYAEPFEHAQARFSKWLESVVVEGLKQWRLTL